MITRRSRKSLGVPLAIALIGGATMFSSGGAEAQGPCGSTGVLSGTSCTYSTVGTDTFTFPAGVDRADFEVFGAQGGRGNDLAGRGGAARATIFQKFGVEGEVLQINVGGRGGDRPPSGAGGKGGFGGGADGGAASPTGLQYGGGGGGGGASDVRDGDYSLSRRLLVAGGGGGSGSGGEGSGGSGGNGGGPSGEPGETIDYIGVPDVVGGGGGTQTQGGQGGQGGPWR